MAIATEKQLRERWLTPEGKKVKQQIIEKIRKEDLFELLKEFPHVEEVQYHRDLRFINLEGIDFSGIDLNHTNFRGANLEKSDFSNSNLIGSDFSDANLNNAKLYQTIFIDSVFRRTKLINADLTSSIMNTSEMDQAILINANLTDAKLQRANLNLARLDKATLKGADLWGAFLNLANLSKANLQVANLDGAELSHAILINANLNGADLRRVNFEKANLSNADLSNCILTNCNFAETNLSGAILLNCKIYGISTWDVKTDNRTLMKNLIIPKEDQPTMIVDDIEIAQFFYFLINNKKILNFLSTFIYVSKKIFVLLLGSFDLETKEVLYSIKDELSKHNLQGIIYDSNPIKSQRMMETVKTLALLSKFVIIDFSKRSGQLYEIAKLVDNIKVPYATIAIEGTKISEMLEDMNDYYWYRKEYFPYPENGWENQLPELVKDKIIPWADEINNRLMKNRGRGD